MARRTTADDFRKRIAAAQKKKKTTTGGAGQARSKVKPSTSKARTTTSRAADRHPASTSSGMALPKSNPKSRTKSASTGSPQGGRRTPNKVAAKAKPTPAVAAPKPRRDTPASKKVQASSLKNPFKDDKRRRNRFGQAHVDR